MRAAIMVRMLVIVAVYVALFGQGWHVGVACSFLAFILGMLTGRYRGTFIVRRPGAPVMREYK